MKCRICGRELTDSLSIRNGVGPECMKKYLRTLQTQMMTENESFDKDSQAVLEAMDRRTIELRQHKCPGCGYKILKPISWTKSTCIICRLSGNKHIYDI